MSKSTALESFQTAYWPLLVHDSKSALQDVVMSRSDSCSPRSRWESVDGVRPSVTTIVDRDRAAWKRSGAVGRAMLLLALQFFSHLHVPSVSKSLYTHDDDKRLRWIAVSQLQFTASDLHVVLASFLHEGLRRLQVELPAVERPRMIEMEDEASAVRSKATIIRTGLSWKTIERSCTELKLRGVALYIFLP